MAKKVSSRRQGTIFEAAASKVATGVFFKSRYKTRALTAKTTRTPHHSFLFIANLSKLPAQLVLFLVKVTPNLCQVVFRILGTGRS